MRERGKISPINLNPGAGNWALAVAEI